MGEYISLTIGGYDFLTCKNSFGGLLLPFSEDDLKISSETLDGEKIKTYTFLSTVEKVKRCLDCFGFTLSEAQKDFERDKAEKIAFAQYINDRNAEAELETHYSFTAWTAAIQKYAVLLSCASFDDTTHCYASLEQARLKQCSISEKIVLDSLPFGKGYFGLDYSNINPWNIFRVILDGFDPKTTIELDYSDLFYGGWCDEFPAPTEYAMPKTIILTEGKFDAEVLSNSIRILYPHLSKFYSFIDFSSYRVQGSTNFLTHYFKAFIASGIQNRIIALYDNDSAGLAELIDIQSMSIPDNFRALHLPDIELANKYPAIGPSGTEIMNINGKACSIEMYLGADVLTKGGKFIPIQWTGLVTKTKTYQGEIIDKQEIQNRFSKKVKQALSNGAIDRLYWKEMTDLLNMIFDAFL